MGGGYKDPRDIWHELFLSSHNPILTIHDFSLQPSTIIQVDLAALHGNLPSMLLLGMDSKI